jgi:4-alpha-glucanotransferase
MRFQRSTGVLLHITSLPSYSGIGDLGPEAHNFLDFLAAAKQHVWQVLPLCPTGYGNSPYAGSSAFAGNPYLISLEFLADWGWIGVEQIANLAGRGGNVDFDGVENRKLPLLHEAARNFLERGANEDRFQGQWQRFTAFCTAEASWLNDYAYYAVLRRHFKTGAWTAWPEPLRRRDPAAMAEFQAQFGADLATEQVLQFAFEEQWRNLRNAAAKRKIRILGDIAIFVSMDSADVWSNPHLFELDEDLKPIHVAGVPPDYFSPTGQRWGNPFTAGTSSPNPATPGGSSASAAAACNTTSSASTTSAVSRPTGPSPAKKRPPSTANGSKPPARSFLTASNTL